MSNVNFVRGLHRVRVSYPLTIGPNGIEMDASVILFGAGKDGSPEISSLPYARFMEFYLQATDITGTDEVYGLSLNFFPVGTGSGIGIRSYTQMESSGTKGYICAVQGQAFLGYAGSAILTDMWGVWGLASLNKGRANGIVGGGKFQVSQASGITGNPDVCAIWLGAEFNMAVSGGACFIYLEDLGSTPVPHFIFSPDALTGMIKTNTAGDATHGLRVSIGGTHYDIMLTTVIT
jgi:hypothetical protein